MKQASHFFIYFFKFIPKIWPPPPNRLSVNSLIKFWIFPSVTENDRKKHRSVTASSLPGQADSNVTRVLSFFDISAYSQFIPSETTAWYIVKEQTFLKLEFTYQTTWFHLSNTKFRLRTQFLWSSINFRVSVSVWITCFSQYEIIREHVKAVVIPLSYIIKIWSVTDICHVLWKSNGTIFHRTLSSIRTD